uniref:Collagenase NC10 and Endostatin n=1 Tax=Schistocephalus solidus TaxID=70667 RepID=A0A0X3PJS8_SCHSO
MLKMRLIEVILIVSVFSLTESSDVRSPELRNTEGGIEEMPNCHENGSPQAVCAKIYALKSEKGEIGSTKDCGKSCTVIPGPKGAKGEPGIRNLLTREELDRLVARYLQNIDPRDIVANLESPKGIAGRLQRHRKSIPLNETAMMPLIHTEVMRLKEPFPSYTRSVYKPQRAIYHSRGIAVKTVPRHAAAKEESVFIKLGNNDRLWLRLPLTSSRLVRFPIPQEHKMSSANTIGKKIFLAPYPRKVQAGEFHGWAQAEKACRDIGWETFGDGGFKALLTTTNRPISKILPSHMRHLPVVNLAAEVLAESWEKFIYGRLANNLTRLIGMDKQRDSMGQRWAWRYYWIGDGHKRTCQNWSSSYMLNVANVLAFNYRRARVVRDIASCSSSLHLLCYSVCDEHDSLI